MSEMPTNIPKDAIMSKVREICKGLRYPIRDFGDFTNQIGRDEVYVYDQGVRISELRNDIPNSYYPFISEVDVANKTGQLYDILVQQDKLSLRKLSPTTASHFPKGEEIPAEQIPPLPDELRNMGNKQADRDVKAAKKIEEDVA